MFMKLLLADPHPQVRSALHLVLSQIPNVTVIGESGDAFQLVSLCSQECPDLILLDPELVRRNDGKPLADIVTVVHRICPGAKVVVISSRMDVEREIQGTGAYGFISKTEPPEIFCEKIARLLNKKERRSSK